MVARMSASILPSCKGSIVAVLSFFAALAFAPAARAQDATPPPATAGGTAAQSTASTGSTSVVNGNFATSADKAAKEGTTAQIQAGGLFAAGNSRSLAVTAGGNYRYRNGDHQFSTAAAANYGRAGINGSPVDTTVENVQGLARYDYFFVDGWSVFFQASLLHDRFQGLDLRLNLDPGVSHYFIEEKKHRLWIELGYDFQHDIRRDENVQAAIASNAPEEFTHKTSDRHSGRLFLGYDNQLNSVVTFTTGAEYLQGLNRTESWRIAWNNALKSAISDSFSAATTFTLRYDHDPLPGVKETDAVTSVALIYNFR